MPNSSVSSSIFYKNKVSDLNPQNNKTININPLATRAKNL